MALLEVNDLTTTFATDRGPVRACDGVSFEVERGEVLGIVGESGSGKTIAALSVMGLVPPPGVIERGSIRFDGEELRGAPEHRYRDLRGRQIGMVFQDAGRALDPVHTVRSHLREASGRQDDHGALLQRVGLDADLLDRYPYQLSGGQRQRVMIAIAIARDPALIIADEPTTAVDALTQVALLAELMRLRHELGAALILVSHNLGLISRVADRVAVMYLGQILELSPTAELVREPGHPYSAALLRATVPLDGDGTRLEGVGGNPDSLLDPPSGCVFSRRCPHADDSCAMSRPALVATAPGRHSACHHLDRFAEATRGVGYGS